MRNRAILSIFFILVNLIGSKSDKSQCVNGNEEAGDEPISDLSMVRAIFKPFTNYSSIQVKNTLADQVPDFLFANFCATSIDLSFNRIEHISNYSFAGICYLEELSVSGNMIFSINSLIKGLDVDGLINLWATDNKIQKLDYNFPTNFKSLKQLDLRGNQIEFIGDDVFVNLVNLENLLFENNKLKRIEYYPWSRLIRVDTVFLSFNKIQEIDDNAFKEMKKLFILDLMGNRLVYINRSFSGLTSLKYLHLGSNLIESIEPNAFLGTNLKNLQLQQNQFSQKKNLFQGLSNLESLNFDFNDLGNLTQNSFSGLKSVTKISLSQCRIKNLESGVFKSANPYEIYLANNKISHLKNDVFEGLDKVKTISLNNNVLSVIEPFAFRDLKSLQIFSAKNNLLRSIDENWFKGLNTLEEINFASNRIRVLQSGIFNNLTRVETIYLDKNIIEIIEENVFANLISLKILSLSFNKLKSLKSYYFKGLSSLEQLYLKSNGINEIQNGSLNLPKNISNIDLSDNFILIIEPNVFRNLKCETLNLAKNQLELVNSEMFENSSFQYVDLSQNSLRTLEGRFFHRFYIKELYLSFNQLEIVSGNILETDFDSNLETLILDNNLLRNLSFLESSQLAKLKRLDVSFNMIEELRLSYFEQLSSLKFLDVSSNFFKRIEAGFFESMNLNMLEIRNTSLVLSISSIPCLSVDLSYNEIADWKFLNSNRVLRQLILRSVQLKFNQIDFSKLINLTYLDLSENLDDGNFTFYNLSSLQIIKLSKMGIKSIERFQFNKFTSLQTLDLSFNEIEKIEENCLKGLEKLQLVDFRYNKIFTIGADSLKNTDLRILFLDGNNLSYVSMTINQFIYQFSLKQNFFLKSFQVFGSDTNILNLCQIIDMSFNSLESFDVQSMFDKESLLRALYLNSNRFTNISESLLKHFFKLQTLRMDSNLIGQIDSDAFRNVNGLLGLNLANNAISSLNSQLFSTLVQLRYLNLSMNFIEFIDHSFFSELYNLETLDLSFNRIKYIKDSSFMSMSNLIDIYINDNLDGLSFDEGSFKGLESIKNIFISFETLNRTTNKISLLHSLEPSKENPINGVPYYGSINILYDYGQTPRVNCLLVLEFLKHNIQVNLKTDYQLGVYLSVCQSIDIF